MIEIAALKYQDPRGEFSPQQIEQWEASAGTALLKHRWSYHGKNVFLSIQADRPVDRFVFASDRLVLICAADLLGSDSGSDFPESSSMPAAYLARMYREGGDSFVRSLHGWFGIVIYDHDEHALKAWTDHFGVRRLVYRKTSEYLALASDLRLLARFFGEPFEVDPASIMQYLQYTCIPAPRTIYKDILRLEPGHKLTSTSSPAAQAYWGLSYDEDLKRNSQAWEKDTFAAIERAVSLNVQTSAENQSLGCFLSGGTDSSSIAGLVGQITGLPARTFSIGFDDPRYNEMEYARIAARHFGADHHEYFVTPQDIVDLAPKAVHAYDEPFGNSSIIPAYYCARLGASAGLTHMLAGDGGDELFGGNQRYADDRVFQQYARLPRRFRSYLLEPAINAANRYWSGGSVYRAARYIRRANIPVPDRFFSYDFMSSEDQREVFTPDFLTVLAGMDPLDVARAHFRSASAQTDLNRWLYLDLKIIITDNDLRKVTGMTELAGIQPRYPLLDPSLAEFTATMPSDLKVHGTILRYLFKQAMRRILPEQIIRKKKHGFGLPFSIWVGEYKPLRDFTFDILGNKICRQRGYFRPDLLEWLWSRYQSESRKYYGDVLWVFLMLELWHQKQWDGRAGLAFHT